MSLDNEMQTAPAGSLKIAVVGGGTAGWMSAAYLQKRLSQATRRSVSITVVESPEIDIIGVGEATIPSFVTMMTDLEVPEYRLFSEADATFKNAIKFVGWAGSADPETGRNYFYHPFDPPPVFGGTSAFDHWMALKEAGVPVDSLDFATSLGSALCEGNRSPKVYSSGPYEAPIPFAYHIDARKLGALLRSIATERGVERIVDTVVSADLDEDGAIAALQLKGGGEVEADLFIDCTGFRGLLIDGVLGSEYESFGDRLLCDRAVTTQVPFSTDDHAPRCYTTSTAQAAGWTWEIDIHSRTGAGYVYSSRFISDDEAAATLRRQIGRKDAQIRFVPFHVGRRPRPWVKNCVAVGLSAGFLEPLESTGIHFIELGLRVLVDHFAEHPRQEALRRQYNFLMNQVYEEAADFLTLHYVFNGRRGEPFWDHCREEMVLPPSLVRKLELWAYKVPTNTDLEAAIRVFDGFSYMAIMAGLRTLPPYGANRSPYLDLAESARVLDFMREQRGLALKAAPPHREMVQKIRSSAG
jgi:tryptophan 7-halogenase